jgi:hydrophobic/amphiphilic exporter-1 (mainly G- bacteria), HAE1 family
LASTCLAVLFVPSFYVVLQRLAERRTAKTPNTPAQPPGPETAPERPPGL